MIISSYSSAQERDHASFDTEYDYLNHPATNIPMTNRTEWDPPHGFSHVKQESGGSFSSVTYSHEYRKPIAENTGYGGYDQKPYPIYRQPTIPRTTFPEQPANAYTQDPTPTPKIDSYYSRGTMDAGVPMPKPSQNHPGESIWLYMGCNRLSYTWFLSS